MIIILDRWQRLHSKDTLECWKNLLSVSRHIIVETRVLLKQQIYIYIYIYIYTTSI